MISPMNKEKTQTVYQGSLICPVSSSGTEILIFQGDQRKGKRLPKTQSPPLLQEEQWLLTSEVMFQKNVFFPLGLISITD